MVHSLGSLDLRSADVDEIKIGGVNNDALLGALGDSV
jgi:hypothetical protein